MDISLDPGAVLFWSPDRKITRAEGACEAVFQSTAAALIGVPLHQALNISEERAAAVDARALADGGVDFVPLESEAPVSARTEPMRTYVRLALGKLGGEPCAHALLLSNLLKGAPPLQISALSSSLSHELRNPLSSVKMAVQTLARNPGLSERDTRRLNIAEREIRTIERMLWMLSEYGRDTPPQPEPVALRGVVQQAVEMIERELTERQARVEVSEPTPAPKVRVDVSRLRPVLAQLLLNVAIGAETGIAVSVSVVPKGTGAALMVEDPSSELLASEQETLFLPFGSRLARGAGLSLAALKQVMLRQGAEVTAEPGEKSGTVFVLSFPPAN